MCLRLISYLRHTYAVLHIPFIIRSVGVLLMNDIASRNHYVSDLGISWARVPSSLLLIAIAAIGSGFVLNQLFILGWYFTILVPFLIAIALGGTMHAFVIATRCRNPWLSATIGSCAGICAYLSYFYFGLLPLLPPGQGMHIDKLPIYIVFRMATDVHQDVGKGGDLKQGPIPFMNWFTFLFELGGLTIIPANSAWKRSRRAYSLTQGNWAMTEERSVQPYQGQAMVAALESGQLQDYLRNSPPASDARVACKLTIEWFQTEQATPLSEPVYASISDHYRGYFVQNFRRTLVRQVELTPEEVIRLLPVLPKLAAQLDFQEPQQSSSPAQVYINPTSSTATAVAQVTPIPEPYRHRVRTKNYALIVNLLGGIELLGMACGIGLLWYGGTMLSKGAGVWGGAPLALGVILLGSAYYVSQWCQAVRENRWIHRRLRQELATRPNVELNLEDPRLQYVAIIPRDSFVKVKWTMSSDLALMLVDEKRREIRLEGDSDRYLIPVESILQCAPICLFHPIDTQHKIQKWLVQLQIQRETGVQELLVSIGHINWWPQGNAGRKRIAESACTQINQMRRVPVTDVT